MVELDFEYANVGDYFHLSINGDFIDEFSYEQLPITLGI